MKETVLSTKTSGTATKRFEVIVEVIKKIPPQKMFFVFFTPCFFYFLGTCSVFTEQVTYMKLNYRLIIYGQIFTPACTLLFTLINCMFTSLMEHSDGLSLLFSTLPGPMHQNSNRLGKCDFP